MIDVIYISGPMSGIENYNYNEFVKAEEKLARSFPDAIIKNPIRFHTSEEKRASWEWYLRYDIKALCDCTTIYMLNGWEDSRGAKLENHVAKELGFKILFEKDY